MKKAYLVCVVLAVIFAGVSFAAAAEGAGYDPKRDPAADLATAMEQASSSGRRILFRARLGPDRQQFSPGGPA